MNKEVVPRRSNRKVRIVAVTEMLLRERGVGGVTTKEIAKAVPCSEGAIYVHFKDRLELLLAVLHESLPEMLIPLRALEKQVGEGNPLHNLETALLGLSRFHERVAPMLCSVIGEPELHSRFQRSLQDDGKGPHRGIATLGSYIEQEQKLGRIDKKVKAMAAAQMLMATSFFHVFMLRLMGGHDNLNLKELVNTAVGGR